MKNNKRKKRKRRPDLFLRICILLSVLLFCALFILCIQKIQLDRLEDRPEEEISSETESETLPAEESEEAEETTSEIDLSEEKIYSFLQGPQAWASRADWSGAWCDEVLAGQKFSVFGCGLCDLANIYSTLLPCDCSPVDMYYYAQEASSYSPVSGYGAIDWPELLDTLESVGIHGQLCCKNESYEEFQAQIASCLTAIVLVNSYYDNSYWTDTSGHYVNIWLYNPEDDTVFLADSGDASHNRQRIPLRYIYDALGADSTYQYLIVTGVDAEANQWGHDGIDADWTIPSYYAK